MRSPAELAEDTGEGTRATFPTPCRWLTMTLPSPASSQAPELVGVEPVDAGRGQTGRRGWRSAGRATRSAGRGSSAAPPATRRQSAPPRQAQPSRRPKRAGRRRAQAPERARTGDVLGHAQRASRADGRGPAEARRPHHSQARLPRGWRASRRSFVRRLPQEPASAGAEEDSSRERQEDRAAQTPQLGEPPPPLQVVIHRQVEVKPWIEHDLAPHSRRGPRHCRSA